MSVLSSKGYVDAKVAAAGGAPEVKVLSITGTAISAQAITGSPQRVASLGALASLSDTANYRIRLSKLAGVVANADTADYLNNYMLELSLNDSSNNMVASMLFKNLADKIGTTTSEPYGHEVLGEADKGEVIEAIVTGAQLKNSYLAIMIFLDSATGTFTIDTNAWEMTIQEVTKTTL